MVTETNVGLRCSLSVGDFLGILVMCVDNTGDQRYMSGFRSSGICYGDPDLEFEDSKLFFEWKLRGRRPEAAVQ